MQVLITPEADGWPATLSLNGANQWEKELIQALAARLDATADLTMNGYRLNVQLEPKHQAEAEPTVPTVPTPDESATDPAG